MDLGATVCTPRNPTCLTCPVAASCAGKSRATDFPVKPAKPAKSHRHGIAWWIERGDAVLLVRRDAKQMLGGMRALPSDGWDKGAASPVTGGEEIGSISHVFTHFSLTLEIRVLDDKIGCIEGLNGEWWPKAQLAEAGLPSLFAKAAKLALMGGMDADNLT